MNTYQEFGAEFSDCRAYRYALWRIWDQAKPAVMFVGLNPSTANTDADPTIRSVERIARHNGFGGFYMMNCFPFISTDPNQLTKSSLHDPINDMWLRFMAARCSNNVVFAWGSFSVVKELRQDIRLTVMFRNAKALGINKNGSPKHPLYCRTDTKLIQWELKS